MKITNLVDRSSKISNALILLAIGFVMIAKGVLLLR